MKESLLSLAEQHELRTYALLLNNERKTNLSFRPTLMRYLRLEMTIAYFQTIKEIERPVEAACNELDTIPQTLSRWRKKYQHIWLALNKNFDN